MLGKLLLVFAALALLASACGGGDDASLGGFGGAQDDGSGDDGGGGDGSAPSDGEPDDSSSSSDDGDSDDGGFAVGGGDWCQGAQEVEDLDLFGNEEFNFGDPDSVRRAFEGAAGAMERYRDTAPDEIQDDVDVFADTMLDLLGVLQDKDYRFLDLTGEDMAGLQSPEFEEATGNIEEYNERACGIARTDDPDEDTSDDDDDDVPLPDNQSLRDMLMETYTQIGFSEDEASCLIDKLEEQGAMTSEPDISGLPAILGECDIRMERLAELG